MPFIVEII